MGRLCFAFSVQSARKGWSWQDEYPEEQEEQIKDALYVYFCPHYSCFFHIDDSAIDRWQWDRRIIMEESRRTPLAHFKTCFSFLYLCFFNTSICKRLKVKLVISCPEGY